MYSIISDITRYKNGKSLDRKDFNESFNLYMTNRFMSMYSDINVEILNSTVNILYKSLSDEQHYKLLMEIIPQSNQTKPYIKSSKRQPKEKDDENVSKYFEESMENINESIKYVFGENNG